jgi:hypothetical protein
VIKIYDASDVIEAHIVRGLLEADGIEAYVGGHYLQGGVGELTAQNFATIHVIDEHAERARRVIGEYENNLTPEGAHADYTSSSFGSWLKVMFLFATLVLLLMFFIL